ncbi:MAG: RelA/SpoT domain-containing protein [Candidatus Omnitrophota bacterium]|jgi:hypothetical protein
MKYSLVPKISKNQINKAGKILIVEDPNIEDFLWAIDLANQWRACHAYPINTFNATLRSKLKDYENDPIVAQRLKRMPTIIDKLKRYPNMQLTTMQDIGGLRAVLNNKTDVYQLANSYVNNDNFPHELIDRKDYIKNPRDEDGYRSIHLIYKYKNNRNPAYDGLRIELQIRTKLQHTWATAVETMGTFLGQALKSRQGDKEWLDFFALTSSAFAHKERSSLIPRFSHLTKKETYSAVTDAEYRIGALEKMRAFSVAVNEIVKKGRGWSYHLIILNSLEQTVQIKQYNRESIELAMNDYALAEKEATAGKKIEPVLVSAGSIENLRRAYPNYFLDISGFQKIVSDIREAVKKY